MIDNEKLKNWAKQIYEIACAHGWHEEKKPDGLWMALVLSEVAEAIEADRNDRRITEEALEKFLSVTTETDNNKVSDLLWKTAFEQFIKGSLEEELADIVIRLLDFISMRFGDKFAWWYSPSGFWIPNDFPSAAWYFVKEYLNPRSMNVRDSIQFILEWSNKLNIDLSQFIEWKMKYNSMRPYKHGGKKY